MQFASVARAVLLTVLAAAWLTDVEASYDDKAGCAECDAYGKCQDCLDGFLLLPNGLCYKCEALIPSCLNCGEEDGVRVCSECRYPYELNYNKRACDLPYIHGLGCNVYKEDPYARCEGGCTDDHYYQTDGAGWGPICKRCDELMPGCARCGYEGDQVVCKECWFGLRNDGGYACV